MADQFSGHPTDIPGLIIFDLVSFSDDRGYFQEKYQHDKLAAAGLPASFTAKQYNVAYNKQAGVTRGAHQTGAKYIAVSSGKIFCALIDLREGDSFGKVVTVTVDENKAVYLPAGVANSYQVLEDNTYCIYACGELYDENNTGDYRFVNVADEALGINWPIPLAEAIISEKDRGLPMLTDVTPVEV
jgi:dTDP-4-dehydrorhamnose 3,5-epimerase